MKDRTTVLSIMRVSIGVTDISRKSVIVFGALTLAIGRILACFHWYGTVDVAMDMLNKCVSGLQRNGAPSLKNHAGRPSAPGVIMMLLRTLGVKLVVRSPGTDHTWPYV